MFMVNVFFVVVVWKIDGCCMLGKLQVFSIGLGVQNMSCIYQIIIFLCIEMYCIICVVFYCGMMFYDVVEVYGLYEVEWILGEGVVLFWDEVVIVIKFGWNIDLEIGVCGLGLISRFVYIKWVVEGMFMWLCIDCIDLLYQYCVDLQVFIEDVVGVIQDLMIEGKVLYWGLCEMGLKMFCCVYVVLLVIVVQSEYLMFWCGFEQQLFVVCVELGIGFVLWSLLGVGFLIGVIDVRICFVEGDICGIEMCFILQNIEYNLVLVCLFRDWVV